MFRPNLAIKTSLCSFTYRNPAPISTPFSTTVQRWPRVRPGLTRRQFPPADEAYSRREDLNNETTLSSREQESNAVPEQSGKGQDEPQPTLPTTANGPTSSPPLLQQPIRIPPKKKAPSGIKPHMQTLFVSDIIYHHPHASPDGGSAVITNPTKAELDRIAAAGRFFGTHDTTFLYSAAKLRDHPKNDHVPEIVVLGASNVGKSTFLNALVGEHGIARVSARPGKTTLLNAFSVGPPLKLAKGLIPKGQAMPRHSLVVVDTPGYGFKSQARWGEAVLEYIRARKSLRGALLLLSCEKRLMDEDQWLLRSLAESKIPTLVVLTKADKSNGDWAETCSELAKSLKQDLTSMQRAVSNSSGGTSEWNPDVYISAAGMKGIPKLGNGGGIGGIRAAILEMAGFAVNEGEVTMKDETKSYTGDVVSFDDVKWKT